MGENNEAERKREMEFPGRKDKPDDDMGGNKNGNKEHEEQLAATS